LLSEIPIQVLPWSISRLLNNTKSRRSHPRRQISNYPRADLNIHSSLARHRPLRSSPCRWLSLNIMPVLLANPKMTFASELSSRMTHGAPIMPTPHGNYLRMGATMWFSINRTIFPHLQTRPPWLPPLGMQA